MKSGFDFMGLIPIIPIFVIMYFFLIRPQTKKAKEHQAMISSLKKGDKVITTGGLIGTIYKISDTEVEIEIAPSVQVKVVRSMITMIIASENQKPVTSSKQSAAMTKKLKK